MEHKSHMQSSEDYLKALFLLQRKTPYIRPTDLAIQMGYTKPSISRAISMLKKDGLITRDREGHICLTEKGTLAAEKVYERHCFFTEQLIAAGVDPETAEVDACRIEHVISNESFERLKEAVFRKQENEISARSKEIKDKPTE